MKNTQEKTQKKEGKLYNRLLEHSLKQYKDLKEIQTAYIVENKVFGIDYISTNGIYCICSNTYKAQIIVNFK